MHDGPVHWSRDGWLGSANGEPIVARDGHSLGIKLVTQMRFFNDELFETGESHNAYEAYWSTERHRMPDALLRINRGMLPDDFFADPEAAINLHDARIVRVDSELQTFQLILHVDHDGSLREISLQYFGVTHCSGVPKALLRDVPESDLMCHETTVLAENSFNHKMLFASSDVLSIDFSALVVRVLDQESGS